MKTRRIKATLSVILAVILATSSLSMTALAAEPVEWALDDGGTLHISVNAPAGGFSSAAGQPWAEVRDGIKAVHFEHTGVEAADICDWFTGCANLTSAAIPVSVRSICREDFADCAGLSSLTYGGIDVLAEVTEEHRHEDTDECLDEECACGGEHNDTVSLMSAANCGISNCTCGGYCTSGYTNYRIPPESTDYHIMTVVCTGCGATQGMIRSEAHTYNNNGYCEFCGFYNAAYDNSGGGSGGGSTCYHNSTYRRWDGCYWTEYCNDCGILLGGGVEHGSFVSGAWEYYDQSQHRAYDHCSVCGEGRYRYDFHYSMQIFYDYSTEKHKIEDRCVDCNAVLNTSYGNHNFSYGSWGTYSSTQHQRVKTCNECRYSTTENADHSMNYGSWTQYTATQHKRAASCTVCGYSATEYASHTLTYGAWEQYTNTQHRRLVRCSDCGYNYYSTAAHTDSDGDGKCDACGYEMSRFSVTVPSSIGMTMSEKGVTYMQSVSIVNNSTGDVKATGVTVNTENGWTLVPYTTDMSSQKVDADVIGIKVNGVRSTKTGTSESLDLGGGWSIARGGSLPLNCSSVISAVSSPVSEQVLSVTFVVEWA